MSNQWIDQRWSLSSFHRFDEDPYSSPHTSLFARLDLPDIHLHSKSSYPPNLTLMRHRGISPAPIPSTSVHKLTELPTSSELSQKNSRFVTLIRQNSSCSPAPPPPRLPQKLHPLPCHVLTQTPIFSLRFEFE